MRGGPVNDAREAIRRLLVVHAGPHDVELSALILKELEDAGWANPNMVAAMVQAAGGRLDVPEDLQANPPTELTIWRNSITGTVHLQVAYRVS
jgi:hypothetical protein